jgi:hypothetical protein
MLHYHNLTDIIDNIIFLYGSRSTHLATIMRFESHLLRYMERQALDLFYPEIHIRKNMEDFVAKNKGDWNLIEYRLERDELSAYENWLKETKMTPLHALNYCASKEVKVSLSYSTDNENWCASLTGKPDNKHNTGSTLTTWSDDCFDALLMGVFKASVIFTDGKWVTRKSSNRG